MRTFTLKQLFSCRSNGLYIFLLLSVRSVAAYYVMARRRRLAACLSVSLFSLVRLSFSGFKQYNGGFSTLVLIQACKEMKRALNWSSSSFSSESVIFFHPFGVANFESSTWLMRLARTAKAVEVGRRSLLKEWDQERWTPNRSKNAGVWMGFKKRFRPNSFSSNL